VARHMRHVTWLRRCVKHEGGCRRREEEQAAAGGETRKARRWLRGCVRHVASPHVAWRGCEGESCE